MQFVPRLELISDTRPNPPEMFTVKNEGILRVGDGGSREGVVAGSNVIVEAPFSK